jgi:hypothetical protein
MEISRNPTAKRLVWQMVDSKSEKWGCATTCRAVMFRIGTSRPQTNSRGATFTREMPVPA